MPTLASTISTDRPVAEWFEYLDDLRESGETNMFGAASYVKRKFKLKDDDARDVVMAWMRTFKPDVSPEERARQAIAKAEA